MATTSGPTTEHVVGREIRGEVVVEESRVVGAVEDVEAAAALVVVVL